MEDIMKKRMFITTIVMMLVLAIALTTSSLAWFSSSQGSVTANAAEFTAGTADGTSVNLKIRSDLTSGAWVT
jgi:flagellar basal body-associated protein FliL